MNSVLSHPSIDRKCSKTGFAHEGGFPRSDAEWCHVLSRQTMLGSLVHWLAISGLMWPSYTAISHTHMSWSHLTVRTLRSVWPNTPDSHSWRETVLGEGTDGFHEVGSVLDKILVLSISHTLRKGSLTMIFSDLICDQQVCNNLADFMLSCNEIENLVKTVLFIYFSLASWFYWSISDWGYFVLFSLNLTPLKQKLFGEVHLND